MLEAFTGADKALGYHGHFGENFASVLVYTIQKLIEHLLMKSESAVEANLCKYDENGARRDIRSDIVIRIFCFIFFGFKQ